MLMTPKSQHQVCYRLPSQDVVPSQPKAPRRASAPARDVHPCPEPGSRVRRGAGGRGCPSGAQGYGSTSVTQMQQQGAAGCTRGHVVWVAGRSGAAAPSAHPSPHPHSGTPLCYCPQACPALPHRVPRAGRDSREMCTSAERAGGGEDEPDNYCLESLTRVPSKIMAQILRKGAL